MIARWLLAAFHLLAFGIGIGAIVARARALRAPLDPMGLRRVFAADNAWGVSALLAIATGLTRAFGGFEKGSGYYLENRMFWLKMTLFFVVFVLEIAPMVSLIRWRTALGRHKAVDTDRALLFARISSIQAVLLVLMLFAATAMARGIGY